MKNQLYFGDNLDILKRLWAENPDGLIDLIYIDPPFNSKRNYNVLFEEVDLKDTKAQKEAFADTWSSVDYVDTIEEIHELDLNLYNFLMMLKKVGISHSAISYLTTMAIRIWYMHKLLNDTGSFYLHCDPTMSHYLKLVCDIVFGEKNFRNEITWKRNFTKKGSQYKMKRLGNNADIILFYTKSKQYLFRTPLVKLSKNELDNIYKSTDEEGRKYKSEPIELPKLMARENLKYEYKGYLPKNGWMMEEKKLVEMDKMGKLYFTRNGKPRRKNFMKDYKGTEVDNIWDDIPPLGQKQAESLGYPTQKPEALLERIINASTNKGDVVADFFCGCGTAVAVAEKLGRKWIGVDISHLAIRLIKDRLVRPYEGQKNYEKKKKEILSKIELDGFPQDIASARELAISTDKQRVKFQDWAIEVMMGGVANPKKTADGGYDGYITFPMITKNKKKGTCLIEIKSGNVSISMTRAFARVIEKEGADMGVFVCFEDQVTKGMKHEAKGIGKIGSVDKYQIMTIEDLIDEQDVKLPYLAESNTFKRATQKLQEEDDGIISMEFDSFGDDDED